MTRKPTTKRRSNSPGASTGAKAASDRPSDGAGDAAGRGRVGGIGQGQAATAGQSPARPARKPGDGDAPQRGEPSRPGQVGPGGTLEPVSGQGHAAPPKPTNRKGSKARVRQKKSAGRAHGAPPEESPPDRPSGAAAGAVGQGRADARRRGQAATRRGLAGAGSRRDGDVTGAAIGDHSQRDRADQSKVDVIDAAIREALDLFDAPTGDAADEVQQRLRERCERLIKYHLRSTIVIALALESVHDRGLWKQPGFDSFGDYVAKNWHYSHARGYQYVDAGEVYRNLVHNCGQLPLPTNEGQIRPMVGLSPEIQVEIWTRVVTSEPTVEITARFVKENVLAVMTEHARRQPEKAAQVAEPQDQQAHDDDDHDQPQGDGRDAADIEVEGTPARQDASASSGSGGDHEIPTMGGESCAGRSVSNDALPRSAVGQLLNAYSGEPRPAPSLEAIDQAHAMEAWIHQIPLAAEEERRRALAERFGCGCCVSMGRDIILTTFWAMVRMENIRETDPGSGMYYLAEPPPVAAHVCAAAD